MNVLLKNKSCIIRGEDKDEGYINSDDGGEEEEEERTTAMAIATGLRIGEMDIGTSRETKRKSGGK